MVFKKYLIIWVFAINSFHSFMLPHEGLYGLTIYHFNDFHARFEETSVELPICRYNNNSCLGGFPRLYHQLEALVMENPDGIVLNAGDSFMGTFWYTLFKWNVTQEFINLLPIDCQTIGNHEFDDGPKGLAPYLKDLKAPVVVANMDTSKEPILDGLYRPHIVIERKGRKIGIIGLITPTTQTLATPGNVIFTDPKKALEREAKILTEKGVDIIILLSHCGWDDDLELAREYGHYVDVIVGGHSHRNESVEFEPYPMFVESNRIPNHKVVIVQAFAFTKYVGNLTIYFDIHGDYFNWEGGPIYLNRSIPEDKNMVEKLAPYAKLVHEAENEPIGVTHTPLRFKDCFYGECTLGNLLTDAFNDHAKSISSSQYDHISLIQRTDLRASIAKGIITQGSVVELLPYNDRLETFECKGKDILLALERSVVDAQSYEPFKGPWMLQVSGLQVSYNISNPEGQRVLSVKIGDQNKILDKDEVYQVTAPGFLAGGGDGYSMINNCKRNMTLLGYEQVVLDKYIEKNPSQNITIQGRIKIYK